MTVLVLALQVSDILSLFAKSHRCKNQTKFIQISKNLPWAVPPPELHPLEMALYKED